MRKMILVAAMAIVGANSFNSAMAENNIKAPEGYQAHLEQSNTFLKNGDTGTGFSTTHGFYYTENTFVGLGFGLNFYGDGEVVAPFYASAKYLLTPTSKVSPTVQMRMGSYINQEGSKPYFDFAAGLRFASSRDFAFSVLLAGSYFHPYNREHDYYDTSTDKWVTTIDKRDLSGISLRIGIEW